MPPRAGAAGDDNSIAVDLTGSLGRFRLAMSFTVPLSGVTAIFGPSGSGKTSLLRAIAGLHRMEGLVRIGAEVWQDAGTFLPVHRRRIGYVFQEPSLFPHLSVRQNLLYGASRSGRATDAAAARLFDECADFLKLGPLLDRMPSHLSGGERQRVSLGRALLSLPRLLLMDEPLSSLDRTAKGEILPYLETLHATLAIPILYVSHDMAEVERLADRIVLIESGMVLASAPLNEALTDPRLPLARQPGFASVLTAIISGCHMEDGLVELDLGGQPLLVAGSIGDPAGSLRRVRIAAGDVSLSTGKPENSTILNSLAVRIDAVEPLGETEALCFLSLRERADLRLVARITRRSARRLDLKPGMGVFAQVKTVSLASGAEPQQGGLQPTADRLASGARNGG
ncbi:molybdenum ABC transporter ATP-binding protein [Mangrovicella endophytica]|uniref:molybdenum ABC transporter ATP-binding protein n=1 Tax=Mangrovicella endophytica TaxID=2066697 RepID=UPI000C9E8988|nr:molybdenum ABC transporter ATP-binding protein [Mangrovicella endophytica]